MKHCSRCDRDTDDFGPNAARKDGLSTYCRPCVRSYTSERYHLNLEASRRRSRDQYHKDVVAGRASRKRYYDANKAKESERKARAYEANRERFLARNRKWREANRERERATNKAYYESHKELFLLIGKAYRARKAQVCHIDFTADELEQRWAYYGNRCWICGDDATCTDHVKPISRGGANMLSNLRPACRRCNGGKQNKWPFTPADAAWLNESVAP